MIVRDLHDKLVSRMSLRVIASIVSRNQLSFHIDLFSYETWKVQLLLCKWLALELFLLLLMILLLLLLLLYNQPLVWFR